MSLQDEVKSSPALAGVIDLCRWIAPPNLHLTLHFLGATPPEKEEALRASLIDLRQAPFSETLDRLLPFPAWSKAGVFGIAAPAASPPLVALWQKLAALLKKHGLEIQERALVPHVTLIRFQRRLKLATSDQFPLPKPLTFPVSAVTLYESLPTKKGSQYEALADFSLAPP